MEPESITTKATRSVKWSALTEIVSRTASPIVLIILARILTPADFGIVATAMIVISLAQMLWDAGLSKALVQTRESLEDAAHIVFWSNVLLGCLIYVFLFLLAPTVALFFNSPDSGPVLRVLGLQVLIASLSSVQQALFVRDFDFRRLFWIKLLTGFVPGLCSIPMAFFGYGVWSLVTGSLAGQVLNSWLLWSRSSWRPKFNYRKKSARKLFTFGLWMLMESLGAWLILWGDNHILGRFLGVHDLGVYRTGWMLVTILFGLTLNPFLPILYPAFSRLQDELPALNSAFHKANRIVIALALPMGVGVFLVGQEAADLLFGQKWQGLGFVVGTLGLMHGIGWLVGINPELYRAMGRPDMNTKLTFAALLYYLPAFYLAAQRGLQTFAVTRLVVALVAMPIHIYLCAKMLSVSPFYLWQEGKPMIMATLGMACVLVGLKWGFGLFDSKALGLLIPGVMICTGLVTYAVILWLLDKPFILHAKSLLKQAASS
jgi:PST family polysaccharide transporter